MRKLIFILACFVAGLAHSASCVYVGQIAPAGQMSVGYTLNGVNYTYTQGVFPQTSWTGGSDCVYGVVITVAEFDQFTNYDKRISVLEGGGSTSTGHVLTDAEYSQFQALLVSANTGFDLTNCLAATAFFFSTTLFFYAVARGAGAILESIRNPLRNGKV